MNMTAESEDSNLESTARALRELGEAHAHLQQWLEMQTAHHDAAADPDGWADVAAAFEIARTVQRAANMLAYHLGAEATDRGARPRVLDWPDPFSAAD